MNEFDFPIQYLFVHQQCFEVVFVFPPSGVDRVLILAFSLLFLCLITAIFQPGKKQRFQLEYERYEQRFRLY